MAATMTSDQVPLTNDQVPLTKPIPHPKSEIRNPQSEIRNPPSAAAGAARTQPQPPPREPPSPRNCRVYLEVAEKGRRQRAVAREQRISQGQVSRIIKSVSEWIVKTGSSAEGHTPQEQLHLALLRQQRELNRLLADTERLMPSADQPYDALTKVVCVDGQEQVQWKLIRQSRTGLGYVNLRDRILNRLAKLAEAECELRSQASAECRVQNAESGQSSDRPAATLHAALCTPHSTPRSRTPPPQPILESVPLPGTPSAPLTPPNWLAYPRCPEPESYDESSTGAKNAKSNGKNSYNSSDEPYAGASPPFMARYWRYQALGLRQELPDLDRRRFVDILLALDRLASQAEAMAWAELLARPPHGADDPAPTYSTAECRALRCIYFDKLLDLDFGYGPPQRQSILQRYDPASGELTWWQPGTLDLPDEDLTWILQRGEPAADDQPAEPPPLPADRGAEVPLPEPLDFKPSEREFLLSLPGPRGVAALRLDGYYLAGPELWDMPVDREQVIIYQVVEEVVREDCGWRDPEGAPECRVEEMSNDESHMTNEIQNPQSEIQHSDSAAATPHSALRIPPSSLPSPLTPALRDEIFGQVGQQGVAVFDLAGELHQGKSLADCGLPHRGFLFLRELAHSLPSWGESVWKRFKARRREGPGVEVQGSGFRAE